jgi:hypothetical protein
MTRAEIILQLQERGLDRVFGKTFDRCLKKELVEAWEGMQAGVRHLSHTQISMYQRCGLQWYYRYQRGIKIAPSGPMVLGGSADATINFNYEHKIEKGEDEKLSTLEDKFHEEWDSRKIEIVDWKGEKPDDIEAAGRRALGAFRKEIAPATQPIEVQLEKEITFSNRPWTFLGYIDLIAEKNDVEKPIIIDNKLAKRSPSPDLVAVHDQLTAYSAAQGILDVGLDVLVYGNKEPKAVSFAGTRTPEDAARYWRVVDLVYDSIIKGVFLPAPRSTGNSANWICSKEWCGYFDICMQEF